MTDTNTAAALSAGEGDYTLARHFEAMQKMALAYLLPEDYRDREGNVTFQGTEHNAREWKSAQRGFRAEAFANDMIYMLDGPEQRLVQPVATPAPLPMGGHNSKPVEGDYDDCLAASGEGSSSGEGEARKRLAEIAAAVEFGPGDGISFREAGAIKLAADIRAVLALHPSSAADEKPVADAEGESAFKIASDLHAAFEQLIYGLPKYLDAKGLTDEENMIREAYITLDVTAHRLAALKPVEG